tara:strand:- start:60 stop:434 length:375 start_codon:yes stop_codon:yes gene_type:complete
MSTLKVNTIQDTSGSNSSTAAEISQGRAKAWANVNGEGTTSIRESYNFSSVTDNGTGKYTLSFTNSMTDANYSVVMGVGDINDTNRTMASFSNTVAAGSFFVETKYALENGRRDCGGGYFAVFR